jgi:calcium/calmodulin-dependent protein kinase kinase 2
LVYNSAFDNVIREIAIMKKLNHQNICRIYEIINDPKDPNIYLVLEYLSKGQLVEWDDDLSRFYRLPDTNDISV